VEDWVKARYWLWFSYSFAMFVLAVRSLLPIPYAAFEFVITSPITAPRRHYPVHYLGDARAHPAVPEPQIPAGDRKNPSELMAMSEGELLQQIKS